jgi:hypothetical protein
LPAMHPLDWWSARGLVFSAGEENFIDRGVRKSVAG